ncbi:hypothetical protein P7K49_022291 [Saguinus oedipus]|uniref:Uncharacterized protein n=1 Tax=Saguinus oedipus TaxID=9490 RepID=A0ABQ9UWT9_SAGOE|nr:hypothetical protein P7K49_022291 [Saguinus oedipus]
MCARFCVGYRDPEVSSLAAAPAPSGHRALIQPRSWLTWSCGKQGTELQARVILCALTQGPCVGGVGVTSLREHAVTLWVLQGYMQPLKQPENSVLCDPSLVDEIFDQIPELLEHHEQFLEQVRHCVQTWHAQQKVGALLVQSVSDPAASSPHKHRPSWKGLDVAMDPSPPHLDTDSVPRSGPRTWLIPVPGWT